MQTMNLSLLSSLASALPLFQSIWKQWNRKIKTFYEKQVSYTNVYIYLTEYALNLAMKTFDLEKNNIVLLGFFFPLTMFINEISRDPGFC